MLAEPQWALIFGAAKKRGARWPNVSDVQAFKREVEAALLNATQPHSKPIGGRNITPKGIALMKQFEGCVLGAYPDPGSKDGHPWTIGYGATGEGIKRGVQWTQAQADERFEADIQRFVQGVDRLLGDAPTTANQFSALVSLAFNIGLKALGNSTLLRKHKEGDFEGAARAFLSWRFNDGKEMRGLLRRRVAEADLYDD